MSDVRNDQRNINLEFLILVRIRLNGFSRDCKSLNQIDTIIIIIFWMC